MSEEFSVEGGVPEEADLTPGELWNQGGSASLRQTRLGLTFEYVGIAMMLLSVLGGMFIAIARLPPILLLTMPFVMIVGALMIFVGPIICLAVPKESGAKELLVGSVVCQFANLFYSVSELFIPTLIPAPFKIALNYCGIFGLILFILFMKKLALYINRQDLSSKATHVLVFGIFMVVASILMIFLLLAQMIHPLSIVLLPIGAL
ncbi:MAG: hypothetical protein KDA77_04750, partial [Planctomycetaceae bacterium]|nr:hypothetical protein [Planctomycetaceae bacterium]